MSSTSLLASLIPVLMLAYPLSGCDSKASASSSARQKPAPAAERAVTPAPAGNALVNTIYQARCMACHGAAGKGDGAGAMGLETKPRDFGDPEWQAQATDEQIKKAILEGGAAVGKSPLMPAHADLKEKREVIDGLVALVRSYKSAPAP